MEFPNGEENLFESIADVKENIDSFLQSHELNAPEMETSAMVLNWEVLTGHSLNLNHFYA